MMQLTDIDADKGRIGGPKHVRCVGGYAREDQILALFECVKVQEIDLVAVERDMTIVVSGSNSQQRRGCSKVS